MTPHRPKLNYAPPPLLHRRRIAIWVWMLLILASLTFTIPLWFSPLVRHLQLIYWQRRCETASVPAGTIVFDRLAGTSIVQPDWQAFYSLLSPPGFRSEGTVFVGRLKNARGEARLIALDVIHDPASPDPEQIEFRSFLPGDFFHSPQQLLTDSADYKFAGKLDQIQTAKADHTDPTHLTINCTVDKKPCTYDLWLQQDDIGWTRRVATTDSAPSSR